MAKKKSDSKLGWHFLPSDRKLGYSDDRVVKVGETLEASGVPYVCNRGMHASERPSHAAQFGKGPVLCRVLVEGDLDNGNDKFCGRRRTVLWMKELSKKDMIAILRNVGEKFSSSDESYYTKDDLVAHLARYPGNDKLDKALVSWAKKNGLTEDIPPPKPRLTEDVVLGVFSPRFVRTADEVMDDLKPCKFNNIDELDDIIDNLVSDGKLCQVDGFSKSFDTGYVLPGA